MLRCAHLFLAAVTTGEEAVDAAGAGAGAGAETKASMDTGESTGIEGGEDSVVGEGAEARRGRRRQPRWRHCWLARWLEWRGFVLQAEAACLYDWAGPIFRLRNGPRVLKCVLVNNLHSCEAVTAKSPCI